MIVLSLPGSEPLGIGNKLAEELGVREFKVYSKTFPDGETYVRITDVEKLSRDEVLIIQTFYPDQNTRIMEFLLTLDALREVGINEVKAIIPYLAYTRQDKIFLKGEPISIRAILNIFYDLGVREIYTIDVHSPKILEYFKGRLHNIIPSELFAKRLRDMVELDKTLIVAPDEGAKERARLLSKALDTEYVVIKKYRDRVTGEIRHELPKDLYVRGRHVVIVDDIISTGGTLASIARFVRSLGAKEVVAVASHGLFVGNALVKLRNSGISRIILIKTVPPISNPLLEYLDPTKLFVEVIQSRR